MVTRSCAASAPRLIAVGQQASSVQMYAPRPAARPLGSSSIAPAGVRTIRTSSRFDCFVRQAMQVR
jgi:hypothetical protein